jgi:flagellar hook assembly protein FlgD
VDAPPREEEAPPVATPALTAGQNPFRGTLSIRYEAPEGTQPVLRIYDVRGALVQDLPLAGSRGTATWDGRGRSGESTPAGVYFLQLVAGSERRSLRVVRMQ